MQITSLFLSTSRLPFAVVLFIYDAFVTFDREVACFWAAERKGGASVLFFANRWISMTLYSLLLVQFASFPSDKVSCISSYRHAMASTDSSQRWVYCPASARSTAERLIQTHIDAPLSRLHLRHYLYCNTSPAQVRRIRLSNSASDEFLQREVFYALRAYVLSRSKLLAILALALSLTPVGASLVSRCVVSESCRCTMT